MLCGCNNKSKETMHIVGQIILYNEMGKHDKQKVNMSEAENSALLSSFVLATLKYLLTL
jgi:hypothetical protein